MNYETYDFEIHISNLEMKYLSCKLSQSKNLKG